MALPALPLLLVAAAGLAAGWAGSTLIGRRKRHETALDEDVPTTTGLGRARPVRTLAWCPVCHAHMAPGHSCRPHRAGEGESRREGGAGPLP